MNAALRAVVRAAVHRHGMRVTGFLDGFAGLLADQSRPLGFDEVSGIVALGGTPSSAPRTAPVDRSGPRAYEDRSDAVLATAARHGIDGLVVIGGDGSLTIARRLAAKGIAVVGIPKTIDNDVPGTDVTLGFDSALGIAIDALDRLHTTAASHHRVMVVEVMGRQAGWIALEAGLAAGGDVILIPEITFRYDASRARRGRRFSIVVIAEGARCPGGGVVVRQVIEEPGAASSGRRGGGRRARARGPGALRGPVRGAGARAARRLAHAVRPEARDPLRHRGGGGAGRRRLRHHGRAQGRADRAGSPRRDSARAEAGRSARGARDGRAGYRDRLRRRAPGLTIACEAAVAGSL